MFLPINREDMVSRGWNEVDIVIVTGDAYVDHPSFGTAIVSRVLEDAGYRVGIVAQPRNEEDYRRFGKPRLAFYINSGNIDSMVAHYTVAKRRRSKDYYTPGGVMGLRPDRAVTAYSKTAKRVYPDVPVAIGGVEASLRRFAHYDYWNDRVMPGILIDSKADLLMFGMGEKQCVQIADCLRDGWNVRDITHIPGTAYLAPSDAWIPEEYLSLPAFEEVSLKNEQGYRDYALACRIQQEEHDAVRGKGLVQMHGSCAVVQNPPMPPLTTEELDHVYELPYMRDYHPSYRELGGVPAIEEVKFSIVHNRGCFGACNFCSIEYHQGRRVSVRSAESVLKEAELLTKLDGFKGYIHDVGGPTANFRAPSCDLQLKNGLCKSKKCLAPAPCKNLKVDHGEYLDLLRRMRKIPGIKKVFIRSGIRFDYLMCDKDESFFRELVQHHVSGQLKVAPEHCSAGVLPAMGKPSIATYRKFKSRFYQLTESMGKKQYLVPYLMSSHPGSTVKDAIELACFLKEEKLHPEQVQDFYPTPGTVSTCMFYTGLDPVTMKKVYVARSKEEKAAQRALLQYFRPQNRELILKTLREAGREDLIGFAPQCLVKPERSSPGPYPTKPKAQEKRREKKTALSKHKKQIRAAAKKKKK